MSDSLPAVGGSPGVAPETLHQVGGIDSLSPSEVRYRMGRAPTAGVSPTCPQAFREYYTHELNLGSSLPESCMERNPLCDAHVDRLLGHPAWTESV